MHLIYVMVHFTPVNLHNSLLTLEKQFHFNIYTCKCGCSSLICYLNLATFMSGKTVAVLSGRAIASGHLEKRQETVIIYIFFHGVSGNRPIRFAPMGTSPLTGIGWSSADALSNFLFPGHCILG